MIVLPEPLGRCLGDLDSVAIPARPRHQAEEDDKLFLVRESTWFRK